MPTTDDSTETRAYYKIRTPLWNPYKQSPGTPSAYIGIAAELNRLGRETGGDFHWRAGDDARRGPVSLYKRYNDRYLTAWIGKYGRTLGQIQMKARALRAYFPEGGASGEADLYFYANAVVFAIGMLKTLPGALAGVRPEACVSILCYCCDLPEDAFRSLEKAFDEKQSGIGYFDRYLPLCFDVWPSVRRGDATPRYKNEFDRMGWLLFDFMLDAVILVNGTVRDPKRIGINRRRVLFYCKWLRKNGIYPPGALRKKLYQTVHI